jgi:glycosyltransferase involved in cell wall biosynthesis
VLFINPNRAAGQRAPVTSWISVASWAKAARRLWGKAWIVTTEGVMEPEEIMRRASDPHTLKGPTGSPSLRRRVPTTVKTGLKDVRKMVEARRFRESGRKGPWTSEDVRFVWQRHDLFHDTGLVAARELDRPLVVFTPALIVHEAAGWGVRRPGWQRLLERTAEAPLLRAADLVACGSDEIAEQVKRLGVSPDHLLVTPNGVDPEMFSPDRSGIEVRRRLGLAEKYVIGWVGSFRRFHGLEMALEAMRQIESHMPEATLLLVGDGLERERIEETVRTHGLRNVVMTGAVGYLDIPEYVAAMDVAIITDRGTGSFHYSPLKLREYMSAGKAVIAPRVGEMSRWLSDGEDAVLIESGDTDGLAAALTTLHDEPEMRQRLGMAARQKILDQATWDIQLLRIDAALQGAAQSQSSE